jgi:hypothetical protein
MGPDRTSEEFDPHDGYAMTQRAVEESRVRFRVDELVGMTVAQARAVVEGAGGVFVTDDEPITAMFSPRRVVASTDGDERVTRVSIG